MVGSYLNRRSVSLLLPSAPSKAAAVMTKLSESELSTGLVLGVLKVPWVQNAVRWVPYEARKLSLATWVDSAPSKAAAVVSWFSSLD